MVVSLKANSESASAADESATLQDRLLAEAEIRLEMFDEAISRDRRADEEARGAGGNLEHRIIVRAKRHASATLLQEALQRILSTFRWAVVAGVLLAMLEGAAVARAALFTSQIDAPVNIFLALGIVLGFQSVLLVALMIAAVWGGPHSIQFFAPLVTLLGGGVRWLTRKLHPGLHHAAALGGVRTVFGRGPIGKWSIGSFSNLLWVIFNATCLLSLLVLLSVRQYSFDWETTILSNEFAYVPITRTVGALPRLLGFPTPTPAQIIASRGPTPLNVEDMKACSRAWSGLLLGSVVCYGLAPRLLLLGLSLWQRRRACLEYRLDTARPEFMRLGSILMPLSQSLGVVDPYRSSPPRDHPPKSPPSGARPRRPYGPPALIGLELPAPVGSGWPPVLPDTHWTDFGMVDNRDDQHRVLERLSDDSEEPEVVVVVCGLTTTPDRGIGTFVASLRSSASRSPLLILTGGEQMRRRGDSHALNQRIEDWKALAAGAGIEQSRVVEIDLDHLTQASAAKLGGVIRANSDRTDHVRLIERAFEIVSQRSQRWFEKSDECTVESRAALHRQIAVLYGAQRGSWTQLLRTPTALGQGLVREMRGSAERMSMLLPARLQQIPKWAAAGAAVGALGCIAAAGLILPVAALPLALSSVPGWAASGAIAAAFAAIVQPVKSSEVVAVRGADSSIIEIGEAVRAAVLFVLLLELQGRDEQTITATLDRVIHDADDLAMPSFESVQTWLEHMRHRFDIALATEMH